jgi:cysteine desulfurase
MYIETDASTELNDASGERFEQTGDHYSPRPMPLQRIFMDHNGGAPLLACASRAMLPFLESRHGNPSSGHWAAEIAKQTLERARQSVAILIGADPKEIVFTSGATEANNMAIKGSVKPTSASRRHIITSAIEHDAVLWPIRYLKSQGARVTILPVDHDGLVDPKAVRAAICNETALITIMTANNETGTIQPIREIARIARQYGIPFHSDAAQAVGKIRVDVSSLGVDLLSLAGHKFGAPNGIGALYIRGGVSIAPLLHGGGHERGRRAGTESALLAAGLGAAAEHVRSKENEAVQQMRDYFWERLRAVFGDQVLLNGHNTRRVPNTLSISFPGHVGADILAAMPEVAATTGSACHAGCVDMSHVLIAMGKSMDVGIGTIRFSLGDANTKAEIDHVIAALGRVIS